jgi:hypothetical protein
VRTASANEEIIVIKEENDQDFEVIINNNKCSQTLIRFKHSPSLFLLTQAIEKTLQPLKLILG